MQRPQTPGRIEALRAVMRNGITNSTPDMLRLAGFGRPPHQPQAARAPLPTMTFTSGVDKLSPRERAALPF